MASFDFAVKLEQSKRVLTKFVFVSGSCLHELYNGVFDFASKCRPLMFDFASINV